MKTAFRFKDLPKTYRKLLGDTAVAYKILSGERSLSKAHIKKLTERFHVSADLFL